MNDTSKNYTCRVCGGSFFSEPLLRYTNMPVAAQHLPDAASLSKDRGGELEICQCSGCGLVQLSNDPVPYCRDVIRASAYSTEMKGFRFNQFDGFVSKFSLSGKKVLEVGCGKGEFLSLMRQCGVDAYGVEHSADSVASCLASGLKVFHGFVELGAGVLPDAPFDAFFILNFLEHLPDLNFVLRGIGENLVDHAVGLVEVPNFDMILKKRLFSEFIGDHLFYFTRETLTRTLEMNGFEVIECAAVWHDYILSTTVRKRGRLDLTEFYAFQDRLKKEIHAFIARFATGRVSVWGAGHQALAVMALLGLKGKIRYVIDSAPFKQGRYTPSSHIPIVAPETLHMDPVDAVIVMAASYSDEVASELREKFSPDLTIAILNDSGLDIL